MVGPINGQPLFQLLNSNFVWNPFLMGLIIGNVFGVHDSWKRGLSYIHKLMPLGIIMLAPHFVFSHATKAGWSMILFAFVIMVLTAQFTMWIGRRMGVDDRHAGDIAGALATGDPHVTRHSHAHAQGQGRAGHQRAGLRAAFRSDCLLPAALRRSAGRNG